MSRCLYAVILVALTVSSSVAQVRTVNAAASESSISYVLVHPLHHIEATSREISSTATIDPTAHTVTGVSMTVDVTTFDSGNSNRDSHAMEVIDAITYPDAKFIGDTFEARGDSMMVTGKLTFHGVTEKVTLRTLPRWEQGFLTVSGTLDISLTAFKVERPSLLMIPVDDDLHFALKALYRW